MKKVIIILFSLFILTGCYNYRELNEIAIVSAIGINKNGDDYEVVVQVVNTQKQGSDSNSSGDQPKFIIYKQKGKTIQEALRYVVLESPKRFYANHMTLLLISDTIAKDGIQDILDYFARDSEVDKQFFVLITKDDKTDNVISTLTALETLNAKNIKDSLLADQNYLSASEIINFEDLLVAYLNKRKDITLPTVIIKGNEKKGEKEDNLKESEPSARIVLDDIAIFSGNKMVDFLGTHDSINTSILNGDVHNTIYTHKCDNDKYIVIEIVGTNVKTQIDNLDITIDIKENATISETGCNLNLRDKKEIEKIQSDIEKEMEKGIKKTLSKLQDNSSDIIGYEDMLYKDNPKTYKKLKKKYDNDLFKKFNFKVNVDLNLYAKGNILKEI